MRHTFRRNPPGLDGTAPTPRSTSLTNSDTACSLNGFCRRGDHQRIYFLWRPHLPDPKDDHLLELGVACGASTIVTHNIKDFRGADQFGIRALPPRELLEMIR